MRTILTTTQVNCCSPVEILCPCQKNELDQLVNFLYSGEIRSTEESESLKTIENLIKIFGFPENLKRNCDAEYPGSDTVSIDTLRWSTFGLTFLSCCEIDHVIYYLKLRIKCL